MRSDTEGIGGRVRRARRGKGITQAQLAAYIGRSESWVRGVENDRLTPDKYSVIDRLAGVLDIDVAWLLGQPYQPTEPRQDAGHSHVPALRTVLRRTSLILSGHPGMRPASAPALLPNLRAEVDRVTRLRQAAKLPKVMAQLPDLMEALNTGAIEASGPDQDGVHGLIVEASHVARMVLNQLGYHDLAWTAVENAAIAAARIGDPLMKACSAWDRCGVLLHTGSLHEAIVVAEAAMADLEAQLNTPTEQALSLWGALNLRCSVASARRHDATTAWNYLREAENTATRLGHDRNDFQTVFGPGNVGIHAAEIAVELDQPDVALQRHSAINLEAVPSKERHTRHRIDIARACGQMKRDAAAVQVLRQAADIAPHYVYNHPMARGLVDQLRRRAKPSTFSAGLGSLQRAMGLI